MAVLWSPQNQAKVTPITLVLPLPTANSEEERARDAGVRGNSDKIAAEQCLALE